jgi:phospholipid-binding lipoprotein MlaA
MAMPPARRRTAMPALLAAALLLGACAGTAQLPPEIAARPELAEVAAEPSVLDVFDPLEGFNRAMYNFNAGFDRYYFLPIVRGYELVTPDFVEDRVSDFFNNLREVPSFTNALLQLKGETAGRAAVRFVVNSLFTLGLFDLAGAQGIAQVREDFGQTLGHWGLGGGPFLVLPVLGPANFRDATGTATDALLFWLLTPSELQQSLAYNAVRFGLQPIDTRHQLAFRYYQTGSPFEYELVRLLYTETRKLDIAN